MRKITIGLLLIFLSVTSMNAQKKKIGLVLSGGGALGYAHVGVIKALEEYGIYPEYIAGTSMGAIIGVLYADGFTPEGIIEIVKQEKLNKVYNLLNLKSVISNSGASSHKALFHVLKQKLSTNSFDSLQRKFFVCVTDLDHGKYKILHSGNQLVEYVIASASIPGVFETEHVDGVTYVDGGVLNNLPADALRDSCDIVIGVDVLPFIEDSKKNTAVSVMAWSIRMMQHQNSQPGRAMCDVLIEPNAIEKYHEFSFDKYRQIYKNGYDTMIKYIKAHPQLITECGGKSVETSKND